MIDIKTDFKFDEKALKNIQEFFAKNHLVKIGVLANEIRPEGFGSVELAAVHEFGSQIRHIPQRSFLRKTQTNRMKDFKAEIAENSTTIMQRIANGEGDKFLGKVGTTWVRYVMETFDAEGPGWQKLSTITLLNRKNFQIEKEKDSTASLATLIKRTRKGSKILQDTGEMKKSITFKVVE